MLAVLWRLGVAIRRVLDDLGDEESVAALDDRMVPLDHDAMGLEGPLPGALRPGGASRQPAKRAARKVILTLLAEDFEEGGKPKIGAIRNVAPEPDPYALTHHHVPARASETHLRHFSRNSS